MYRPHCVRSVLTTSVKILPYRPPARLIRAKENSCWVAHLNVSGLKIDICANFVSLFPFLASILCHDRLLCLTRSRDTVMQRTYSLGYHGYLSVSKQEVLHYCILLLKQSYFPLIHTYIHTVIHTLFQDFPQGHF